MAKTIKYKFLSGKVNRGTEEAPEYDLIFFDKELICSTEAIFVDSLPIAQAEAYNGEYTVEGEFDPEPVEPNPDERIAALEAELAATKILLGVE